MGHLAVADLMRTHGDLTFGTPPIHMSQARGQRQRAEHSIEQKQIDHAGLVNDQQGGNEWIVFRVQKGAVFGVIL
jgi:hypothetical protein